MTLLMNRLESDGGYTGIVVQISEDVREIHCKNILDNLEVTKKAELTLLSNNNNNNNKECDFNNILSSCAETLGGVFPFALRGDGEEGLLPLHLGRRAEALARLQLRQNSAKTHGKSFTIIVLINND